MTRLDGIGATILIGLPLLLGVGVGLWALAGWTDSRVRGRMRPRAPLCSRLLSFVIGLLVPCSLGIAAAPPIAPPPLHLPSGPLEVEGRVIGPPRPRLPLRGSGGGAIDLRVKLDQLRVGGRAQRGTLNVILSGDPPIGRGDRITVEGRAIGPGFIRVPTAGALHTIEPNLPGLLDRTRRALRHRLRRQLPRRAAGWGCALLLGDRGLLPGSTVSAFRSVGQGHLLAISGLHVGLIYATLRLFARRLPGPGNPGRGAALALALLVYAGIAGGDPPVLRAALFAALALLATRARARPRLPELWIVSFLVLGAWTEAGHELGFWLSFTAVAAIAVVIERTPPREPAPFSFSNSSRGSQSLRRIQRIRRAGVIATAAWLGAQAVLVHATPEVVPFGPVISLLLAPWLAVMLVGTILALIPGLSFVMGCILEALARLGEGLVGGLDALPGTPWLVPPIPPSALSACFLALLALLVRAPRVALSALTIAVVITIASPPSDVPRILATDLGRGQGVFVIGKSAALLFDAGSVDLPRGGAVELRNLLWRERRTRLDAIILSHSHADHVLAVPGLLSTLDIGVVIVGPRFGDSSLGASILESIERAGVPWRIRSAGTTLAIGDFQLQVLHPADTVPASLRPSANDDSLVVHLEGEGIDLLAPGDLEGVGVALVVPPSGVETLILPHHGRDSPGLEAWLETMRPRTSIACGGEAASRVRTVLARWNGRCLSVARDRPVRLLVETVPP